MGRAGSAACFIGNGAFGGRTQPEWVPFFAVVGIPPDAAYALMPLIGMADIAVGVAVLFCPSRVLLLYMTAWALWTAALRPLSGDSLLELFERAGNYGVPLAMLLLLGRIDTWRDLITTPAARSLTAARAALVGRVLAATTALLLFSHGAQGAFEAKAILLMHADAIGL